MWLPRVSARGRSCLSFPAVRRAQPCPGLPEASAFEVYIARTFMHVFKPLVQLRESILRTCLVSVALVKHPDQKSGVWERKGLFGFTIAACHCGEVKRDTSNSWSRGSHSQEQRNEGLHGHSSAGRDPCLGNGAARLGLVLPTSVNIRQHTHTYTHTRPQANSLYSIPPRQTLPR